MDINQADYEAQATKFLMDTGTKLTIKEGQGKELTWDVHGLHYRVTLKNKRGSHSFDFWGSQADLEDGKTPTAYDVLACLQTSESGDFMEFCNEFGYDSDSRKAQAIYNAVQKQVKALARLYDKEELALLGEIR